MEIPAKFFATNIFKVIPKEAIALYLVLRADIELKISSLSGTIETQNKLVSALSLKELSDILNLADLTIKGLLNELAKHHIIEVEDFVLGRKIYILGHKINDQPSYFIDSIDVIKDIPREEVVNIIKTSPLQRFEELLSKAKAREVKSPKDIFKPVILKGLQPKDVLITIANRYQKAYGDKYPINFTKDIPCVKTALRYAEENYSELLDFIDFVFDNIKPIHDNTWIKNRVTPSTFASNTAWVTLTEFRKTGVKSKISAITDRAKPEELNKDKDIGW